LISRFVPLAVFSAWNTTASSFFRPGSSIATTL